MEIDNQNNKYRDFTFEDFLQDDFFIQSTLKPTEKTRLFWQEQSKDNRVYRKAVKCIEDLNKDLLDEKDMHKVWHLIRSSNHRKQTRLKRYYFIIASTVAATIALLFYFNFESKQENIDQKNIRDFALRNIPVDETSETQLFVSDEKIITTSDTESTILYDSASVKVTSKETAEQEISKNELSDFNQLVIPKGKRSSLTLADGTRIWANSGTRLVYPSSFTADKREIFVDGEIYIDVKTDHDRPFIVQTGDLDVTVLGTKFNVQAYQADGQKRLVLQSGSVKISSDSSNEEVILKPSEMYEAIGANITVKPVNVDNYTSWIDGLYICDSERLDFILARLSRYYGKEINVDKEAAGLKCKGKLDLKEDLDDVLRILQYIVPINYTRENETYTITYKS